MILFLVIANMVAFFLHLIAEFFLLGLSGKYSNFLLVENLLIAYTFTQMAVLLYKKREKYLKENLAYWIFFVLAIIIFKPCGTTLEIVSNILPVKQWIVLLVSGLSVIFVNLLALHKIKRGFKL